MKETEHQHFQKPKVHLAGMTRKLKKEKSFLSKKRNLFEELPDPAFTGNVLKQGRNSGKLCSCTSAGRLDQYYVECNLHGVHGSRGASDTP